MDRQTDRQTMKSEIWVVCIGRRLTGGRTGNREAYSIKVLKVSIAELPMTEPIKATNAHHMTVGAVEDIDQLIRPAGGGRSAGARGNRTGCP